MVNQRETTHVRIDKGLHKLLKKLAEEREVALKSLIEDKLGELVSVDGAENVKR